ncbi:unnamed protein product [marine sediment metagenome]|uniref:Uncharacterized protein n=1 Tax=marine sediment metagenome TaxID=412755 RepID=X1B3T6_9ZZZZ
MKREDLDFTVGGMWEKSNWEISFDREIWCGSDMVPCKHCGDKKQKENKRYDGNSYYTTIFVCPSVVIGINEGGHNSTGICLQCIIEANETIK